MNANAGSPSVFKQMLVMIMLVLLLMIINNMLMLINLMLINIMLININLILINIMLINPMLTAISASVSVFSLLWLGVGEVPPPRRDATAPFSFLRFCLS